MISSVKEEIRAYGRSIGLDCIGFANRWTLAAQDDRYEVYRALGYSSGFEEKEQQKRNDPQLSLNNCQTVIAAAIAYPHQEREKIAKQDRGRFAYASWGRDYHRVMSEKLCLLGEFCRHLWSDCHYQVMVDTGSLSDRGAAFCAGLGWIGRNSNLINQELGSFIYLGELLLDVTLDDDDKIADGCGDCRLCVEACPLGAIDSERRMVDARKCLAYSTLNKAILSEEVMTAIGQSGTIYGCDICQSVCPYNQQSRQYPEELWGDVEMRNPYLPFLLSLSNKEFQKYYGHLSGAWRGATVIKRNSVLVLGAQKNEHNRAMLTKILTNEGSESLKTAGRWALAQFDKTSSDITHKE